MAQEQEQNRTEQATPFKLREARRRGQVAKSLEINSFAMLCVALALVYFAGAGFGQGQLELSSALLRNAAVPTASGAVGSADEARALAGRIAEALRGNASHAVQAYAGINADAVQALLAKA
jgi:hypothetical protein